MKKVLVLLLVLLAATSLFAKVSVEGKYGFGVSSVTESERVANSYQEYTNTLNFDAGFMQRVGAEVYLNEGWFQVGFAADAYLTYTQGRSEVFYEGGVKEESSECGNYFPVNLSVAPALRLNLWRFNITALCGIGYSLGASIGFRIGNINTSIFGHASLGGLVNPKYTTNTSVLFGLSLAYKFM